MKRSLSILQRQPTTALLQLLLAEVPSAAKCCRRIHRPQTTALVRVGKNTLRAVRTQENTPSNTAAKGR